MKKICSDKFKGSFTIEAIIVMSTMLMILFAIFYAFMLLYQNVTIMHAASYAAEKGAEQWFQNAGLYRYFKELSSSNVNNEKKKIENIALESLKGGIIGTDSAQVNVDFKNSLGKRSIIVKIDQKIKIPFSGIVKYFNNGKDFEIKAKASAEIAEPTEYIRNLDYGIEWITVIGDWLGGKIGDAAKKNDLISKAFDIIEKLGF